MDTPPSTTAKDERLWAMFAHLSAFSGHLIPFGHLIGPLIIWSMKKDEFPLVNDQGKESLNFQISSSIYFLIAGALCFVLIGFLILPVLWVAYVVLVIIAGIKANDGTAYRYPATIRFLK